MQSLHFFFYKKETVCFQKKELVNFGMQDTADINSGVTKKEVNCQPR